jgi:hypothetical protein
MIGRPGPICAIMTTERPGGTFGLTDPRGGSIIPTILNEPGNRAGPRA